MFSGLTLTDFLDQVMRYGASKRLVSLKRNFYHPDKNVGRLSDELCVRKGTYSAFRMGLMGNPASSAILGVNVDVCNTAFWEYAPHITVAWLAQRLNSKADARTSRYPDMKTVAQTLLPVPWFDAQGVRKKDNRGNPDWTWSDDFKNLRRVQRLKFTVRHRGKLDHKPKMYTIDKIIHGSDAKSSTFTKKDPRTGREKTISVFDHFLETYNARLEHPDLPLVATAHGAMYPMEVCTLADMQLYRYKLNPDQTANMIKFAVTRPPKRRSDIEGGVKTLAWNQDDHLREFGIQIQPKMLNVPARLLPNPEVRFNGDKINPATSGRWDLRGKKFLEPNVKELSSWAFVGVGTDPSRTVQMDQLKLFAQTFVRTYRGHGGRIARDPVCKIVAFREHWGEVASDIYKMIGNECHETPQFVFVVLPDRNSLVYERLKKNFDCRFAIPSQMVQLSHVKKNNPQYHSNVAMKVNAKLGGATCRAWPIGAPNTWTGHFRVPTVMIGVDVSHAGTTLPDSLPTPSMAAVSMSIDNHATKWIGACQTNGVRVELLHKEVIKGMVRDLLVTWVGRNKGSPQHVYYMRDGVDEGQFRAVIEYEIASLRELFIENNARVPQFTVIVATKRHHIRMFPRANDRDAADRNGNVFPGTLLEHGATTKSQWDFFLNSHAAIQGTARPVHYHVIYDDAKCQAVALQRMLYEHCYQYARATTPVSLHPAIYYAHLISNRARAHEDVNASIKEVPSGKLGFPLRTGIPARPVWKPDMTHTEQLIWDHVRDGVKPVLKMGNNPYATADNTKFINNTMWFI
jgi:eukaryotic translation initiation factor 2C